MMAPLDRYRAAGLAANPFALPQAGPVGDAEAGGTRSPTSGPRPSAAIDRRLFVDRGLPPPPTTGPALVQVIGDRGFGKSTQLLHWRRDRPGPYHHVPPGPIDQRWRRPPIPPDRHGIVYGDEVDRMPRPVRWRWFRRLARTRSVVVIGTHRDLAGPGRRAGLVVTTHHLGPVDRPTLDRIVERRLSAARLPAGPESVRPPELALSDDDLSAVHRRSGGSIRVAEDLLHQMVADRVGG